MATRTHTKEHTMTATKTTPAKKATPAKATPGAPAPAKKAPATKVAAKAVPVVTTEVVEAAKGKRVQFSHADCAHPRTPAGRAECRQARKAAA
jgi:3-hydroxyisobutyrate dehydrogenase-like beta-hydroxyacid dehydrogenase